MLPLPFAPLKFSQGVGAHMEIQYGSGARAIANTMRHTVKKRAKVALNKQASACCSTQPIKKARLSFTRA